jgi:hypothetical protein
MRFAKAMTAGDSQCPRTWPVGATLLVSAAIVLTLLLPGIYNRYPLIFPDTGAYLSVAYGNRWTLDRSAFYGLLNKPILVNADAVPGLWTVLFIQVALLAAILLAAARRLVPTANPATVLSLVAATAVLTALPWHSAQLMPDAYTGPLIMLAWMAASSDPSAPGSPLLWFGVFVLGLMHYTHVALIAVAVTGCVLVLAAFGTSLVRLGKRMVVAGIAISAILAAHVAAHGILFDRWSVSPMGSMFLFARLHEDGLVDDWFKRHCGRDAPQPLCKLRSELPRDSQVLLWGGAASPLTARVNEKVGQPQRWHWVEMLHQG